VPFWKVFLDPADRAGAMDFQRWWCVDGGSASRAFAEGQRKQACRNQISSLRQGEG
jgi:hypothetical protein